jgi:hypothetical protein
MEVSLGAIFFEVNAGKPRVDHDFSPWKCERGQNVQLMAQKSAKKKPKTSADSSVLGSLPSTRPTRLGGDRRVGATRTRPAAATATTPKPAKPKAAKPKARPKPAVPSAPPAGWQVPGEGDGRRDGGPAEIVTTAVQAAGELAQIGVTVGSQLLRRAAQRIPRP